MSDTQTDSTPKKLTEQDTAINERECLGKFLFSTEPISYKSTLSKNTIKEKCFNKGKR